jgi:hypothetical protein
MPTFRPSCSIFVPPALFWTRRKDLLLSIQWLGRVVDMPGAGPQGNALKEFVGFRFRSLCVETEMNKWVQIQSHPYCSVIP